VTQTEEAKWYISAGKIEATEKAVGHALSFWEQARRTGELSPLHRKHLAEVLQIRGMIRHATAHSDDAVIDLKKARSLLEELTDEFPEDPRFSEALCRNYVDLGNIWFEADKEPPLKSRDLFVRAQERFDRLPPSYRNSPNRRFFESRIYQSMGRLME